MKENENKIITHWYESNPGDVSCLRIGFMIAMLCGALGNLFCIVFAIMLFATKSWEGIPIIITLASSSFGIMAVGDMAKNMQKRHESVSTKGSGVVNGK